ncbi:hypothetical protein [Paenibacillus jamilae]|uniref:hypothetical protein n=1 Tax=Paenibacillus jamilae TaxID=114136 RepID=UPI000A613D72|nr:hypothetical protein [Paenibacillus jamilae]
MSQDKKKIFVYDEATKKEMEVDECGFEPEGLARKYLCINGKWDDYIHMEMYT